MLKYTRTSTAKWYPQRCHWRIDIQRDGERKTFEYTTDGNLHRLTVLVNKVTGGYYGSDRVYVKYIPIEEV